MRTLTSICKRLQRDASGFSIVEMLVVFTVLAVALLPLASIQFRARQEISESMRQGQANQLALDQIERLRAAGFANAQADTGTTGPFDWTVQVAADPANPFLQELQVQVQWTYNGQDRTLTMASKQAAR